MKGKSNNRKSFREKMDGANLYEAGYEAIPELWTEGWIGCVGFNGFSRYRETV